MCHVSLSTVREFPCPRDLLSTPHPGQPEKKKSAEQQVCFVHHSKWRELPPRALPPEPRHGHFTVSTANGSFHHWKQRIVIHYNRNSTVSPVGSYPRQVLEGLWKPEHSTKGKHISSTGPVPPLDLSPARLERSNGVLVFPSLPFPSLMATPLSDLCSEITPPREQFPKSLVSCFVNSLCTVAFFKKLSSFELTLSLPH